LALDDTPPTGRARGSLTRVLKASSRAKELVRQILTFSRRTEREQHTLHADKVIGEALRLMEASLPKDIEISACLQAQDCAILADPSQTHQIVMNLCTNAAQAMKRGGRMSVATRLVHLGDNSLANPHRLPAGQYLSLTVEDTGEGIAPDVLGRIFDPFFTTKGSGEGTGLGLAVVHGIVLSLGGTVFAQSEPGQGARLTMLLPTAPDSPAPAHEPYPGNPTGRERILLVDDESDLLDMVCQFLEPLGYQVAPHNQPEAALEAFLASPQSFDLVLTDQSMPRLSGIQLATRLREVRPDLPVVLCSGFSMVIPPDRIQALGKAWLLAKPFTSGELTRVVRQALANTRGEVHAS
ncbi:MAG: ATP-binding protein, partial [Humidesulfovibrio sp.]|nr:ATP-binding protein [Humidesulfovibrio sp.]